MSASPRGSTSPRGAVARSSSSPKGEKSASPRVTKSGSVGVTASASRRTNSGRGGAAGDDPASGRSPGRSPKGERSPSERSPKGGMRSTPSNKSGGSDSPDSGRSPRARGLAGRKRPLSKKGCSCPTCRCCVSLCPPFYCCHPETLLDRNELIQQMKAASKGKQVNMALVDDQMRQDRDRRMAHKTKWRRFWTLCICSILLGSTVTGTAVVLILAVAPWTMLNRDCDWTPRTYFGVVYTPEKKVFLVGGTDQVSNFADVWTSDKDGQAWSLVITAAAFGPRYGHALVCDPSTGSLFVIAGGLGDTVSSSIPKSDVWKSVDGRDWFPQTNRAPWPGRKFLGAVVNQDGKIFIAGGMSGYGNSPLNDLWSSGDEGQTWQVVSLTAPWTARHSFGFTFAFGGPRGGWLYILGGDDGRPQHDVWASVDDGKTWTLSRFSHTHEMRYQTKEHRASWSPRLRMTTVVDKDGLLTLLGGQTDGSGEDAFSNEVWQMPAPKDTNPEWYEKKTMDERLLQSQVPLEWKLEATPPWTPRRGHQSFIDEDGVAYIMGGEDATGLKNDMWKMESSMDVGNLQSAYDRTRSEAAGDVVEDDDDEDGADTAPEST